MLNLGRALPGRTQFYPDPCNSGTLRSVLQQYLHYFFCSQSHNERSLTLVIFVHKSWSRTKLAAVQRQDIIHVHVLRASPMPHLERSICTVLGDVAEQPLLLLVSGYSLELGCHICTMLEKHPGFTQFDVNYKGVRLFMSRAFQFAPCS